MPHGVDITRYIDTARQYIGGFGKDRFRLEIEAEVVDHAVATTDFVCHVVPISPALGVCPSHLLIHFNAIAYEGNIDQNDKSRREAEDFVHADVVDPFKGTVTLVVLNQELLRAILPHAVKAAGVVDAIGKLDIVGEIA